MNPINYEFEKDLAVRWINLLLQEQETQRLEQLRQFRTSRFEIILRPSTKPLNCRNGNGEEVAHV